MSAPLRLRGWKPRLPVGLLARARLHIVSVRLYVCAVGNRAYRWGFSRVPGCPLSARLYVCAVGNRAYRWPVLARARFPTAPTGGGFLHMHGCELRLSVAGFWHLRLSCGITNWRVQPPRQPCPYRVYTQNYRSVPRSWRRCCSPKRRRCARSSRHR